MRKKIARRLAFVTAALLALSMTGGRLYAADRLVGVHSAQVLSQSMPWIAQEAGLFKKYDLDFHLVFISSSPVATAAALGGDAEVQVTGAIGNVRAYVQGAADLVFIGGVKNFMTHNILARPEIRRPEDLRGKKIGVGRFGSNTHYFTIQALRRLGMDAARDVQAVPTGGGPETLAALVGGRVEAASLVAPGDAGAAAPGFRLVVNGAELRISYGAGKIHAHPRPEGPRPVVPVGDPRARAAPGDPGGGAAGVARRDRAGRRGGEGDQAGGARRPPLPRRDGKERLFR